MQVTPEVTGRWSEIGAALRPSPTHSDTGIYAPIPAAAGWWVTARQSGHQRL